MRGLPRQPVQIVIIRRGICDPLYIGLIKQAAPDTGKACSRQGH